MKWLIVGTSGIAQGFANSLKKLNEEITRVINPNETSRKEFIKKNNIKEKVEDYDCVYIATPNHLHYEHAKIYILEGKNVLIEKPMTHSVEKTIELFELAKKIILEWWRHMRTSPGQK